MTKKLYDLSVSTGEYQSNGQTKKRWMTVGALMESDQGGKFILLERWFNPAGIANPDGRSNVLLSLFEPKQADQSAPARTASAPPDDFDDSAPF